LVRPPVEKTQCESPAFLRELFKFTKASALCQQRILLFSMPASPSNQRRKPKVQRSANSQRTTGKMPAPSGEQKHVLLGLAMVMFSLGIPYRGSGAILPTSPDPTNQLPTSLNWGRPFHFLAPGHRDAPLPYLQLFEISICQSHLQAVEQLSSAPRLQLSENTNGHA
jgi:hypothetical protein